MESSEPLVQFEHEAEDDEPLLELGGEGQAPLGGVGGGEPPAEVHLEEKDIDGDEDEPMIQLHFKDYEDDSPDYTPGKQAKRGLSLRVALLILVIVVTVALFLVVLGLALSARSLGINPSPTASTPPTSTTLPTTASPTTAARPPPLVTMSDCGSGLWLRVAFFNMNDTSQECPRGWRGYDSPVRCCGRPVSARSSRPSVYYSTNGFQYSRVCGRAIGYQVGSPDCFGSVNGAEPDTDTVDGLYVDGVSVTYGNPRNHIWTFAVGLHERSGQANDRNNCPCDGGVDPPPFVGNSYSCETGDDTPNVELKRFYSDDPLWDGKDCHNATCCAYNSPPWFTVDLPGPTTDDIEVRICGDQSTGDEDTPIALLELYVQQ